MGGGDGNLMVSSQYGKAILSYDGQLVKEGRKERRKNEDTNLG